jgi:DNA repair photolyase
MKPLGIKGENYLDLVEFNTNFGSDKIIFVGSGNDMFAADIPKRWIIRTLNHCAGFSENEYFFQSKNPARFAEFFKAGGSIASKGLCTTIETNRWYPEIMQNAPTPQERAKAMTEISKTMKTYVTIEPIMDFDLEEMVQLIRKCNPVQVNIGADSKECNLPEPDKGKILTLINELQKFTTIEKKDNLWRLLQ